MAASVLRALFATLNLLRDPVVDIGDLQMASIDKQFGEISVNSWIANAGQMAAIEGGDLVETGSDSGLALGWHDGGSLRLDENTLVVFEAADQIYLQSGRVYFDSETGLLSSQATTAGAANLSIRTDHGVLRHLGTQYMTRVDGDDLVISVREGVVSIDGNVKVRASAGQQFAISGSGELSINDIDGFGGEWKWVEKSAPAVNLEGRLISDALSWVASESGYKVHYDSAGAQSVATQEILRGFPLKMDIEPTRALYLFMETVDLNAQIEGELIVISEN